MKKLLSTLLLISGVATAAEITVINEGNPQSPTSVFGQAYRSALGSNTQWEQATSCQDAQKKLKKTPNAVLIWNSSNDFIDKTRNPGCKIDEFTTANTVLIATTHMKICRAVDNTRSITGSNVKLGLASMVATQRHQADWNRNGFNIKFVPYGGSAGVVTATINKEVDYGWIASSMATKQEKAGRIECVYSTDRTSPKFVGNSFKLSVPDFEIITVVYTNSADPAVLKQLKAAATNKDFVAWADESETKTNTKITNRDLENINGYVARLIYYWGDR